MEKMITGLPYDINDMNTIRNKGAIADMNNINFPNIPEDKQINVAYIFLRNTDYPVTYDFSKCSFEKKSKFLNEYITTSVGYKLDELIQTWMAACCFSLGIVLEDTGIFNKDELKEFVECNLEIIGEIIKFLISLPVYALYRFEVNGKKMDISDIPTTDVSIFNENIYLFLYHPAINIIITSDTIFEPTFYTHYFTNENNKLFDSLQGLPYMPILYGLSEKKPEEWKEFLNVYSDICGTGN